MNIEGMINGFITNIGEAGNWTYAALYRQAGVTAFIDLLFAFIFVVVLIALNLVYFKNKKFDKWFHESADEGAMWALYIVVSAVCLAVIIPCCIGGINALVNPEYWVLEKIRNLVHYCH